MGAQGLLENIQLKRESQVSLKYLFKALGDCSPQTRAWTSDDGFSAKEDLLEKIRLPWLFTHGE